MFKSTTVRAAQRARTHSSRLLYALAERLFADSDGDSLAVGLSVSRDTGGRHLYRAPILDRFVRCEQCLGTGVHRTLPGWCERCQGTGAVDLDDPELPDLDDDYLAFEAPAAPIPARRNRRRQAEYGTRPGSGPGRRRS